MVKVSINIITKDKPVFLKRAIQSILGQDFKDFEIIIVDNGGGGAKVVVDEFKDDRLVYLTHGGVPLADARNLALREAKGEYIAILDDDDIWCDRYKLSKQVAFLDLEKNFDIIGTQISRVYADNTCAGVKKYPIYDDEIRKTILKENPYCHSAVMYRRAKAMAVGGYEQVQGLWNIDEYKLWLEMGIRGLMYNLTDVCTKYTVWPSKMGFGHRWKLYIHDFKMISKFRKYYPDYPRAFMRFWIQYPLKYLRSRI
ncbi:MAG: glycosyltransferase [Patescibacteria group bacterium]|jgi:glycosyltransferase involved in cell wall biosynthesis